MENKKKAALVKKITKAKTIKKEPVAKKKTREEIEKMFAFNFGCDCSCCSHHCDSYK
ncbi:MAG TPA: hypothetical protein PK086_01840 [bacterium]|nr:hypothetical protein [bacterium]